MKKTQKRHALLMSALSLLLCVSMLVGTTFAWFTDSVVSANNIIKSGNLDVELYYKDSTGTYTEVGTESLLSTTLWEPGHVEVVNLKVANKGSLALKYQLNVSIVGETGSVNQAGEPFNLSDYIQFAIVEKELSGTRDEAVAEAEKVGPAKLSNLDWSVPGIINAGEPDELVTLVVWMPTTVGNEANHATGVDAPTITMGINLFATQQTKEKDSFDHLYDDIAAVFTVAEANALMAQNKDANLVGANEPSEILYIPANYTGTLVLNNVKVASVQESDPIATVADEQQTVVVPTEHTIVILGNVIVKATQEGMSAITGTKLNITGDGKLTAIGKGLAGFGIGGMATESVTVSNVTIKEVVGGFAGLIGTDTKYYKDAPEGGAAIGSGKDGAVITLNKVDILKALGGSKAAAIGARYHVGVTVNITDSVIDYAEGGVSAAAIGGSRVSSGATESGTTINIANSTITAKGGAYGAGIGSGYDTHCLSKQPLCTINIDGSTINATGGQYAAGVGTGYHNAALAGEIKNSTVNAVSGEKIYKASYTAAMDIGFGVTDPTREGQQTDSKLIYNGKEITLESSPAIAMDDASLVAALNNGETTIVLGEGSFVLPNAAQGKKLTIIGSGKTQIATNTSGSYEGCNYALDGSTVVFENITITTDGKTYTGYARCDATYNNCVINNTFTLYGISEFNNCTFNVSGDSYNLWTWGASKAAFNNCTFNSDGKAVLLYGTVDQNVTFKGCTFNDKGGLSDLKAAIEIGNDYGKSYILNVENTVVNGYEINDKGISTGSTLWGNKNAMATDKLTVVVDGTEVYGPNA